MSQQGPPPEGEPTAAVPPTEPSGEASSSSVFGEPEGAAAEPTVVVPPVADPGQGTPPPGGGGDGPDGPEGDDEERPWYAHPAVLVLAGLIGATAIALILILALGGDEDRGPSTTSTTTSTSTTATSTTIATTESRCRAGDQAACDEFSDAELQRLCDEGATSACQVLLGRQGEGVEPDPPAPEPAPSDFELCRGGDAGACSRLSTSDVSELCGMGVTVACEEADTRFDEGEYDQAVEDCRAGIDAGCQVLTNDDLAVLCDEGVGAACAEIDSRTGE